MHAPDKNPLAAALKREAELCRGGRRTSDLLAEMFGRLAELERRLDKLENEVGLRRYLGVGGRLH